MTLTRLRYFIAVAETRNVGRAAQTLNVAQPALSRQLKALEEEVGTPLLIRHPRGVELTQAGVALLNHARETVRSAEAGLAAARVAAPSNVVRVTPPDWPHRSKFVAAARDQIENEHPEIEVQFSSAPWTLSVRQLRSGDTDVGFSIAPLGIPYDDDIDAELLIEEPGTSALIPATHPLASRDSLRLADLKDLPTLIPPRDQVGALHDQMAAAIRSAGYEPRIIPAPLHYSAATHMVSIGAGWIITVDSISDVPAPGTVVKRLDDARFALGFSMVSRKNDCRPAVEAFRGVMRRVTAQ